MQNSLLQTASKRAIQKTAGAIGDITGNEITDKITRFSKTSLKNNSQTNEGEEIFRETYMSQNKERKSLII